ncbi:hypothetical protein BLA60_38885 [Actinophytocola xinjiangensis]|uniref:AMP-dependent synthetase/ligase domain-containing protein n=1 Tax=Actinophytocola xinjiangensis TaxID=485602 RepID=A0A7Z0WEH7_9PSEU|nr:AMP-binding protein [Actinophytocola xinjiangensis]OLF04817.1 hypothetical protein BLA60_38885 [Actinophytocola xinjiangensis]
MTVLDAIAAHAARTPHQPAVVGNDAELTYGELLARIDRLAGSLVAAGVGPERICGVALDSGVDAVVGLAAVLRAGGAFRTWDVDRTACVLTTGALAATVPAGVPVVLADDPAPAAAFIPRSPGPRSLAYVSPDAVLVEHLGLVSSLVALVEDCDLGPNTVTVRLAPLGTDASVREIFGTLVAGGRLVVLPRATLARPAGLGRAAEVFGVNTILGVTPSCLGYLTEDRSASRWLRAVRLVVTGGESLRPFLASGGRNLLGGRLLNQYGPPEVTLPSTRQDVPTHPETEVDLIGTPHDGVTVHLLSERLEPVPDGTPGEVYLGGPGVARGYLGRPADTATRFLPDPFGPPGARMFRTGDLARRLPDGTLVHLGDLVTRPREPQERPLAALR